MATPAGINQALGPGDTVAISGIYRVTHMNHRVPHDVLAIRGEELLPCRTCAGHVRFRIARRVVHMTEDWDLAGLTRGTLNGLWDAGAAKRRVS